MTETDEITAWLRKQAEADIKARAGEAYCCESCPGSHPPSDRAQDETARAESVLAVLDLYEQTAAIANPPECPQGWTAGRDYLDAQRELAALDPVVRLLAAGYRHRDGFKEAWGVA